MRQELREQLKTTLDTKLDTDSPITRFYVLAKRVIDVSLSLLVLIASLPMLAALARCYWTVRLASWYSLVSPNCWRMRLRGY
jgi:lipopolysaccharide/colanic/teichoic acid biosynthesis glycosyltransferase